MLRSLEIVANLAATPSMTASVSSFSVVVVIVVVVVVAATAVILADDEEEEDKGCELFFTGKDVSGTCEMDEATELRRLLMALRDVIGNGAAWPGCVGCVCSCDCLD